jgi:CRP-like cAMP-binding protein
MSTLPFYPQGLCSIQGDAREALNRIVQFRDCEPGELLFQRGQKATGVYIVCHGGVKLVHHQQNPNEFELACESALIGLPGVMMRSVYHFSATVLVRSTLAFVSSDAFIKFVEKYPEAGWIVGGFRSPGSQSPLVGQWVF